MCPSDCRSLNKFLSKVFLLISSLQLLFHIIPAGALLPSSVHILMRGDPFNARRYNFQRFKHNFYRTRSSLKSSRTNLFERAIYTCSPVIVRWRCVYVFESRKYRRWRIEFHRRFIAVRIASLRTFVAHLTHRSRPDCPRVIDRPVPASTTDGPTIRSLHQWPRTPRLCHRQPSVIPIPIIITSARGTRDRGEGAEVPANEGPPRANRLPTGPRHGCFPGRQTRLLNYDPPIWCQARPAH